MCVFAWFHNFPMHSFLPRTILDWSCGFVNASFNNKRPHLFEPSKFVFFAVPFLFGVLFAFFFFSFGIQISSSDPNRNLAQNYQVIWKSSNCCCWGTFYNLVLVPLYLLILLLYLHQLVMHQTLQWIWFSSVYCLSCCDNLWFYICLK